MITEEERRTLEEKGYSVIFETNLSEVKRYNTNVFILYDGEKVPYYDSLSQIPPLPNGKKFMLSARALPKEVRNWDSIEAYIHKYSQAGLIPFPPWWVIGLIILTVLTAIVFIGVYYIVKAQDTRCGATAEIKDISECMKIIVAPDCSIRTYDACKEEWSDEDWHKPTPPTPSVEWLQWLIIGTLLVGGTYVAIKYGPTIIKKLGEAKSKITSKTK